MNNTAKFVTTLEQHEAGKRRHHKTEYLRAFGHVDPNFLQRHIAQFGPYMYHGTTADAAHIIMNEGLYPHNEREQSDGPEHNVHCDYCGEEQPDHGQTTCMYCKQPIEDWAIRTRNQGNANFDKFFRTRDGHVYLGSQDYLQGHGAGHIKGGLVAVDLRKLDPTRFNADEDHFMPNSPTYNRHHPVIQALEEGGEMAPSPYDEDTEDLGSWAERIGLGSQEGETPYSMEKGSMAYNGHIPPDALHLVGTGQYNPQLMDKNPWQPEGQWNQTMAKTTTVLSGDGHITCKLGHTHWGKFGAAGVLFRHTDPTGEKRYLLTLRSNNVMEGGCWGIPGGAINSDETPLSGSLREAREEIDGVGWVHTSAEVAHSNDHGGWSYTTVLVDTDYFIASVNPEAEWETDDVRWFTAKEIDQMARQDDLHCGFAETWAKISEVENRVTQSDQELHVGLAIPRHSAKAIFRWARDQQWPEGTDLEQPGEYHCTLMYTPEAYETHKDAWWIKQLDQAHAHVNGVKSFSAGDKGYAYVLTLDAPEIEAHGTEMQNRARQQGLKITDFPGGYHPHITFAYGPTKLKGVEPPNLELVVGPSSVSPPRKDKIVSHAVTEPPEFGEGTPQEHCGLCTMFDHRSKICWAYGNKKVSANDWCKSFDRDPQVKTGSAEVLDHLSLSSVAHNLHYRFEQGSDTHDIVDYAQRLLKMIGYEPDDLNTQAAIQTWQQLYPGDQLLGAGEQNNYVNSPEQPAQISESAHFGSAKQDILYHWTESSALEEWMDASHTGPGETHLTRHARLADVNDIPDLRNPIRIAIDTHQLDPELFAPDQESYPGNRVYRGPIPQQAVIEVKLDKPLYDWDNMNVVPSLDTDWQSLGEDEKHHNDVQFSNDTRMLA